MKRSIKTVSTAALAVMLVLAFASSAFAATPFAKVAGDVAFRIDGVKAKAEFKVRQTADPMPGEDHAPATGRFEFDSRGVDYVAVIEHVHVHEAGAAHFGGKIVKADDASFVGKTVHVSVVDKGRKGDTIAVVVSDTDMHEHGTPVPVTSGNLVVK